MDLWEDQTWLTFDLLISTLKVNLLKYLTMVTLKMIYIEILPM